MTQSIDTSHATRARILDTFFCSEHNLHLHPDAYRVHSNESIQIGPKDAVVRGHAVYVSAGYAGLFVFRVQDRTRLVQTAHIPTLGNATEVAVGERCLYVADRVSGVLICDIADPFHPAPIGWYDSLEFATGIAVSGSVLAVCNRKHGIEFCVLDSDGMPKHVSEAPVGEAQSVRLHGNRAYVGEFGESRVAVVDISDPARPVHTCSVKLDGIGWGVDANSRYLVAATGHQLPAGDTGSGHGFEVHRILPGDGFERICRVTTPPYYRRTNDWWRVRICGDYLLHSDGLNGVSVFNWRDPGNVELISNVESFDYAGGADMIDGRVVVADLRGGVHLVEPIPEPATVPDAPKQVATQLARREPSSRRVYVASGNVRQVCDLGDTVVAAAGQMGLVSLRLDKDNTLREVDRTHIAPAVIGAVSLQSNGDADGRLVCAALRNLGIGVFSIDGAGMFTSTRLMEGSPVDRVAAMPGALIGLRGEGGVVFADHGEDALTDARISVPFFPKQLASWRDAVVVAASHEVSILRRVPGAGVAKEKLVQDASPIDGAIGVACEGDQMLLSHASGLLQRMVIGDNGVALRVSAVLLNPDQAGEIAWNGPIAVMASPVTGVVTIIDIDPSGDMSPRRPLPLPGHPRSPSLTGERCLIPCGRAGVYSIDLRL